MIILVPQRNYLNFRVYILIDELVKKDIQEIKIIKQKFNN